MSSCNKRSRRRQSLTAILLLIALIVAPSIERASGVVAQGPALGSNISQRDASRGEAALGSASATPTDRGVRLEWRTTFEQDNLGFDVYRVRNGQRTQLNRTLIPGSAF